MAIYFFYGDEDYNIDLELEKMSSKLNPDFKSMSLKKIDNPSYQDLVSAIRTPPMMFGNMLIIINLEDYLYSKKKNLEEAELSDIEDALANNPEGLDIAFVVKIPREDARKIDTRKKLYKILSKYNSKEFPVFKTYKISEISAWINSRAKIKGISVNKDAVNFLIQQIGNDLRVFDSELDKLQLAAYPEKIITKQMVEENCVSNQDLFNFTDFIMKNMKDKALLEFQRLIDKKHPLEILSATQTMLRKWIILKLKSKSCSTTELSQLTGMHEFVIKQTLNNLKDTKLFDLVKLKEKLFEVEYKLKSAETLDVISEVECAIIK